MAQFVFIRPPQDDPDNPFASRRFISIDGRDVTAQVLAGELIPAMPNTDNQGNIVPGGTVNLPGGQKGLLDGAGNLLQVMDGPRDDSGGGFLSDVGSLVTSTAPVWGPALTFNAAAGFLGGVPELAGSASAGASSPGASAFDGGLSVKPFGYSGPGGLGAQFPTVPDVPGMGGAGLVPGASTAGWATMGNPWTNLALGGMGAGSGVGTVATGGGTGGTGGGATGGTTTAAKVGAGAGLANALKAMGVSEATANTLAALSPLLGAGVGGLLGSGIFDSDKPAGTITTVQDVPDWQKPGILRGIGEAGSVLSGVNESMPALLSAMDAGRESLTSAARGDFMANPGNETFGALTRYSNPNESYLEPTARGDFLTANPFLDKMIQDAQGSVASGVNSQFTAAGRYGSGAHAGVLTDRLGALETGLRASNYDAERNRMLNAGNALITSANQTQGIRATGAQGLSGNYNTGRQQQLTASLSLPGFANEYVGSRFAPVTNYSRIVGQQFGQQTQAPFYRNGAAGALSGALGGLTLGNLFR